MRAFSHRPALSLVGAALLCAAGTAAAQDMIGLTNIYSQSVLQQGVIQMGKPTLEAGQRAVLGRSRPGLGGGASSSVEARANVLASGINGAIGAGGTSNLAASSPALRYKASPSVSTALRRELAEHMARTNPAQAQNIRQALSTDAIWKEFSRLLSSFGYSGTNVADVMTGYYVINWEVVNGADASGNTQGIRAARDRFAAALASNPDFLAMSDADKQRAAESMGYLAAVAGGAKNELIKSGNRAGLAELQNAVQQSVMQTYGIDLKQLKLTPQGFVPG